MNGASEICILKEKKMHLDDALSNRFYKYEAFALET